MVTIPDKSSVSAVCFIRKGLACLEHASNKIRRSDTIIFTDMWITV